MNELTARTFSLARAQTRARETQLFWGSVVAVAAVVATVLCLILSRRPPHEDEVLVLFIGRESLGGLLHTVVTERGGAPLHFVLGWIVERLGGGLTELRALSLVFAVASVPLIAVLARRVAGSAAGVAATVIAAASWMVLFHGVYGRMYSLFLFTSLLSFIAILSALDGGGRRRFAGWGVALVATLASHPYALLVVAAQAIYVLLRRERTRESLVTFAAVAVAAAPLWWADIVLRDRFDVGVGGGGAQLGSPAAVFDYLWRVAADFSVGANPWLIPVLLVALFGVVLLGRRRRDALILIGCVVGVPAAVLTVATLGSTTSPESRHLIYILPFFALLLAVALVEAHPALAVVGVALLVLGGVRWAHGKTPSLFEGEPTAVAAARDAAARWLAATQRPSDVFLGYEPVYIEAWHREPSFARQVLPRADPKLLAETLQDVRDIGRGVWVFDAYDTTNLRQREAIALVKPRPAEDFEAHVFGPYLVIRSRDKLGSPQRYLATSTNVMRVGQRLRIGDASVNLAALASAASHF